MRRYETIYIANPDLQEGARKALFDKFTNLLTQEGGVIVKFEDWGNKKLAYEINKKSRGHYVCMTYGGTGEIIKELERNFRLDENIMKFMTILLEKDVSAEDLNAEIEASQAAESESSVSDKTKEETPAKAVEETSSKSVEKTAEKEEEETSEADDNAEEATPEAAAEEVEEEK